MSQCIKTGCTVFLDEYQATVRADLHQLLDDDQDIIIVKFNVNSWVYDWSEYDCEVIIGSGYYESHNGLIVVPRANCKNIEKYIRS